MRFAPVHAAINPSWDIMLNSKLFILGLPRCSSCSQNSCVKRRMANFKCLESVLARDGMATAEATPLPDFEFTTRALHLWRFRAH